MPGRESSLESFTRWASPPLRVVEGWPSVKLSKELSRPGTGDTIYILDEPTTGMHFEDIRHLLNVLHGLVDAGNTVIVIEHNMDIIKQADHVIDLGPEGGRRGGEVLFEGPPEALADADTHTSDYLREELERTRAAQAEDGDMALVTD